MNKEALDTISKTILGIGFLWMVVRLASTPEAMHLLTDPWLMSAVVLVVTGSAGIAALNKLTGRK